MKCVLKWTNKYSQETGYVGKVLKTKGHFVNAECKAEAKKYPSENAAIKDVVILNDMGEADANIFHVIAAI